MDEKRLFRVDRQFIEVRKSMFTGQGSVLDVGAGGEGVIAQVLDGDIVGIDVHRQELQDAHGGGLKLVMDARDMKFLDGSFNTVTAFFALMYIPKPTVGKVFEEVFRVLRQGGRFMVWDTVIPPCGGPQDLFVVPVEVTIDEGVIRAGYGAPWPDNDRDMQFYLNLGTGAGFTVTQARATGNHSFQAVFEKTLKR
jgi:SAM-dependent methyltransferase